jgi:Putative beta-barrel porin-2, OmpL-like. bbp2
MKYNAWTLALIGAGVVSLPAVAHAEEHTNEVLTALSATTISGYVDTSMQWNPGTGNQNLPTYTPNGAPSGNKADGFNFNVLSLTLSKPPGEGDWAVGYNATLIFGPDAVGFNNSFGTPASDFSLMDTYVELRAPVGNGLDFKLGTFACPLGYEVYQTGNNPNYTRSYGYEIEPTQLTGLIAAYQFSPAVSATAGIVNTWNAGINNRAFTPPGNKAESFKTYCGSVTLTVPDSMGFLAGSTLSGGIVSGYNALVPNGGAVETSFYAGSVIKTPLKTLNVGLAFDYACLGPNQANSLPNNSAYQYAGAVYLLWQATEKLSFNTRADYFSQSSYLASAGLPGSSFALTESVQYDLWKNVLTRAEFRWDHAMNGSDPWGPTPSLDNEFMLALNVIYKF